MPIDLSEVSEMSADKVGSDPNETREAFIAKMKLEGYHPEYPEYNQLQLDIDNAIHMAVFERSFEIFAREMLIAYGETLVPIKTPSRSGTGFHIRISLPFVVDNIERIAWQAALGSDPVRELLSLLRSSRNDEHPTMLIEKD